MHSAVPLDVALARQLTPGTAGVNHLNNAGSALPPQSVVDAVTDYLAQEALIGGYEMEAKSAERLRGVYNSIARFIGASDDEIALAQSATSAWSSLFQSIPFRPGDRVLTGRSEYVSNALGMLQAQQRLGIEIVLIDNNERGEIDLGALRAAVDERTRLIALTHVPTSGGLVNPAAEVGRIARAAGVLYLLDACQSAGQLPLDVNHLGCDMLSVTGRKFVRAPRGTGFLYVRRAVVEQLRPQLLDGRSATWSAPYRFDLHEGAQRFELFEASYALRVGLGAAVDHALSWGVEAIAQRVDHLATSMRNQLRSLGFVQIRDQGRHQCGIVTFEVDNVESAEVQSVLAARGVNVSLAKVVAAQFDLGARGLDSLVRASPHYYNTDAEIDQLVEVVAELGQRKR